MNKHLAILIIFLAMLSSATSAYADPTSITVTVTVTQDSEPEYVYDGPVRHRIPPRPIMCTITPDGVSIPSISADDILAYDVYSPEEDSIVTFSEEQDFITFIYGNVGTYEIRIHISGYVFHGYVNL